MLLGGLCGFLFLLGLAFAALGGCVRSVNSHMIMACVCGAIVSMAAALAGVVAINDSSIARSRATMRILGFALLLLVCCFGVLLLSVVCA